MVGGLTWGTARYEGWESVRPAEPDPAFHPDRERVQALPGTHVQGAPAAGTASCYGATLPLPPGSTSPSPAVTPPMAETPSANADTALTTPMANALPI